jgi:O-antigen/teichoic acid export membrane protein
MKEQISRMAGSALIWKGLQHGGVKIIFFIRLLILARLLSPDDFGLLAISMVALDIMTQVTDFGMVPALVQRSEVNDTHYNAAWTVGIIRALTITGAVILMAPFVSQIFNEPRATLFIQVLAIRPLLEASASIKVAELIRNLRFRSLTYIKLPEALANTIIAVSLAPLLGVWALVAGALAGPAAVLIISYILAPHRPRLCLDRTAMLSLIRFGRWMFVTGLIVVSGSAMLRAVISRQLGTAELGLYFLAARLAFLPAEVASNVIGEVTFPLYARLQTDIQKVARAFQSVLMGMFAVLVPICALLIAIAPSLVDNVLGSKWEGTVPVIRILAFGSVVGLLGENVVPFLKGVGQPYKVVVIEGVQTFLLIVLVWILTSQWGLAGAALSWLPAIAVSQFISAKFIKQLVPRPFEGLMKPLFVITGVAVSGAVIASGINTTISGLTGFIAGISLAAIFMGVVMWVSDRRFALGLGKNLARVFPQFASLVGYSPSDR